MLGTGPESDDEPLCVGGVDGVTGVVAGRLGVVGVRAALVGGRVALRRAVPVDRRGVVRGGVDGVRVGAVAVTDALVDEVNDEQSGRTSLLRSRLTMAKASDLLRAGIPAVT